MDRRSARRFAYEAWALLFGLALCISFANAAMPDEHSMVFSIVRSIAPGCEPSCPEWIFAEGKIVPASPEGLKRILKQAGKRRLPILITSQGGEVDAAIAMGRIIRERGLETGVAAVRFQGCLPRDPNCALPPQSLGIYSGIAYSGGAFCVSACPLMLAGGVERLASTWAYVGVHQITTSYTQQKITYKQRYKIVNGKKKIVERVVASRGPARVHTTTKVSASLRKRLLRYFGEMGLKTALLDAMSSTPPEGMLRLSSDMLLKLNIITRVGTADELVDRARCTTPVPASHCRISVFAEAMPRAAMAPKP